MIPLKKSYDLSAHSAQKVWDHSFFGADPGRYQLIPSGVAALERRTSLKCDLAICRTQML
jgi:hypothetical protein